MSSFIDSRPSFSHIHPKVSASAVVTITAKMLKAVSGWRWLVADWCAAPHKRLVTTDCSGPTTDYWLLELGEQRVTRGRQVAGLYCLYVLCWPLCCPILSSTYTLYTICLYLHRQPGLIEPRRTSELVELTRRRAKPLPRDLMPVCLICCKSSRKINHQS